MAQLTDLEKVRKSRLWKKRIQGFFTFLIFSAAVFGISFFLYHKGNVDLRTAMGDAAAEIAAGSGFPVAVPSGKLTLMEAVDDALLVTTDSNLYTYNSTGRRLLDLQHGMIIPTTSVAGGRFLLYDRGGKKAHVYSRNNLLASIAMEFPIYDGDLARNGNFAVVSGSDKFLSQVVVYNGDGTFLYRCSFIDRPAVSVGLADNKDALVVGLLDVSDGDYISTILRYEIPQDKASAQLELPGEMILHLNYADGDTVRMLSQKRAATFNSNLKQQDSYSFEDYELVRFRKKSDGKLLLHLRQSTGAKKGKLILLDTHLKEVCSIEVNEDTVQDIQVDNNNIYLLREDALLIYDLNGQEVTRAKISDLQQFFPMDGLIYYATSNELCTLTVKELSQGMASNSESSAPVVSSQADPTVSGNASEVPPASQPSRWDLVREAIVGSSSGESASTQTSSQENISSATSSEKSASGDESAAESLEDVLPESSTSSVLLDEGKQEDASTGEGGQDDQ